MNWSRSFHRWVFRSKTAICFKTALNTALWFTFPSNSEWFSNCYRLKSFHGPIRIGNLNLKTRLSDQIIGQFSAFRFLKKISLNGFRKNVIFKMILRHDFPLIFWTTQRTWSTELVGPAIGTQPELTSKFVVWIKFWFFEYISIRKRSLNFIINWSSFSDFFQYWFWLWSWFNFSFQFFLWLGQFV